MQTMNNPGQTTKIPNLSLTDCIVAVFPRLVPIAKGLSCSPLLASVAPSWFSFSWVSSSFATFGQEEVEYLGILTRMRRMRVDDKKD